MLPALPSPGLRDALRMASRNWSAGLVEFMAKLGRAGTAAGRGASTGDWACWLGGMGAGGSAATGAGVGGAGAGAGGGGGGTARFKASSVFLSTVVCLGGTGLMTTLGWISRIASGKESR